MPLIFDNIQRFFSYRIVFTLLPVLLDRLRVEIAVRNGVQIITSGMKVHLENPSVISNACHALAVLAASGMFNLRGLCYCTVEIEFPCSLVAFSSD